MDDLNALNASLRMEEKLGELKALAERVYVQKGYAFSGALSPLGWVATQLAMAPADARRLLEEAQSRGLLVQRECDLEAWELPIGERARLIDEHDLARCWKHAAPAYYPTSRTHGGEVAVVMAALQPA